MKQTMASYCRSLLNLKPPYKSSSLLLSLNLSVRSFSAAMSPPSTAIVYDQEGPPDSVTKMVKLPPVEIKENDVCVKMLAAPINPSDINRIQGVYPVKPQMPAVGGYEGVGEVHAVGSAVKGLSPGDLVIPCPPSFGTWQTYVVKEQSVWHKVDKGTPVEYAATVFINPLTALKMLEDFVDLNGGLDQMKQKKNLKILARMKCIQRANCNLKLSRVSWLMFLNQLWGSIVLAEMLHHWLSNS